MLQSDQARLVTSQTDRFAQARLILAPMEVLADKQFRAAIGTIGGMDEAVHEFIRICSPLRQAVRGCIRNRYDANEMGDIPIAAQIMGGDPVAMGVAAHELATEFGAMRVDLNCGCPAKKVTGRGAGASLLKKPDGVFEVVRAMVDAVEGLPDCRISVKMRSGFDSTDLFGENIRAAAAGGATMITLHPRTKVQGYAGRADWDFIRRAKEICGDVVEVVGNGDVTSAEDAILMLESTGCDHVMVGRGAVKNPWIFWEIREALARRSDPTTGAGSAGRLLTRSFEMEREFYRRYFDAGGRIDDDSSPKCHKKTIGRMKMLVGFATTIGEDEKRTLLASSGSGDARKYLEEVLDVVAHHYNS